MANNKKLDDLISKAIDYEISRRIGQISNATLKSSIEEMLRDAALERIGAAMTSRPPKPLDIAKAVQESIDEMSTSIKNVRKPSARSAFTSANSNDYGGKDGGYGGKSAPAPRRSSPSFGGKDSSYGGK